MGVDLDSCGFGDLELRGRITARRRITGFGSIPEQMHCVPQLATSQAAQRAGMEPLSECNGNPYEKPWDYV